MRGLSGRLRLLVPLFSEYAWKVARYTSAAPFYFRASDNFVDGGLLANDPSLHALTTIQNHLRSQGRDEGVSLVVSLGSGTNPAKAYRDMEITKSNLLQYLYKHGRLLHFMFDLVSSYSLTYLHASKGHECLNHPSDIGWVSWSKESIYI